MLHEGVGYFSVVKARSAGINCLHSLIMKRLYVSVLLVFTLATVCAQTLKARKTFLSQRVNEIIAVNKDHFGQIVISDVRIKWDTTDLTLINHLNWSDIPDGERAGEQVLQLINELDEEDYVAFKTQISQQGADRFIKVRKVNGEKDYDRYNELVTITLSQPLVARDGALIIVKEKIDSYFCMDSTISVYEMVEGKWVNVSDIFRENLASKTLDNDDSEGF